MAFAMAPRSSGIVEVEAEAVACLVGLVVLMEAVEVGCMRHCLIHVSHLADPMDCSLARLRATKLLLSGTALGTRSANWDRCMYVLSRENEIDLAVRRSAHSADDDDNRLLEE